MERSKIDFGAFHFKVKTFKQVLLSLCFFCGSFVFLRSCLCCSLFCCFCFSCQFSGFLLCYAFCYFFAYFVLFFLAGFSLRTFVSVVFSFYSVKLCCFTLFPNFEFLLCGCFVESTFLYAATQVFHEHYAFAA